VPRSLSDKEDQPEAGMKVPQIIHQAVVHGLKAAQVEIAYLTRIAEMREAAITIQETAASVIKPGVIPMNILQGQIITIPIRPLISLILIQDQSIIMRKNMFIIII
jgi:hypothetical protein